jgi:hypothetical protein
VHEYGPVVKPGRIGAGWFLIKEGPPLPLSPLNNNLRRRPHLYTFKKKHIQQDQRKNRPL